MAKFGIDNLIQGATVGEKLKQRFLDSIDPDKKLDYKAKAKQYLEDAIKNIQDNIDNKKIPIYKVSSDEANSGIITKDNPTFELFQDFTFGIICREMADEMDLVVDITMEVTRIDTVTRQPIPSMVMIVTFK